ncbi:MAG: hypothetical protein IPG79_16790 [Saprospiraceae bacterium]|nr:hypothetical protein [Saprospiraceae bacterium]
MKKFNEIILNKDAQITGNLNLTEDVNHAYQVLLIDMMATVLKRDLSFITSENIKFIMDHFSVDDNGEILYTEKGEELLREAYKWMNLISKR